MIAVFFLTSKYRSIYNKENNKACHQRLKGYVLLILKKDQILQILLRKWISLLQIVNVKMKLISGKNSLKLFQDILIKTFYREIQYSFPFKIRTYTFYLLKVIEILDFW